MALTEKRDMFGAMVAVFLGGGGGGRVTVPTT